MKAVKVEWLDICSGTPNWARLDDLEVCPLKCESVGWLIKETEDYISIAQNYCEEEKLVSDTMTFPKKIVTKISDLH